ncbi:MAG: YfcE family phosphodiesterase [Bacilli bacterium]|nr:YfcE family phosphodiesterase [Bacilli bacterium]
MKILLVSDTHGNNEVLDKLVKKHPDMDLYLHLGDSEATPEQLRPFITVRGNCDYFSDADDKFMIRTEVGYLFAAHKPPFVDPIVAEKSNITIICHGHTHKRRFEKIGKILYINPGAISFARDGNDLSYLILEIENSKVKHTFINIR